MLSLMDVSFNTTLVTVYRGGESTNVAPLKLFQYNSCYCLSSSHRPAPDWLPEFQYNSCYCLSPSLRLNISLGNRFNTTLVTVYQSKGTKSMIDLGCFNTTLVTVYHFVRWMDDKDVDVSIQLLLLFIVGRLQKQTGRTAFQYNSCYCLSFNCKIQKRLQSFNTTLVTVYRNVNCDDTVSLKFQYNSCYCLSCFRHLSYLSCRNVSIQLLLLFIPAI